MFKFNKTLRRLALAALIAGSLVSTSFGASRGLSGFAKSFMPQSNSSHFNSGSGLMSHLQNARKQLPSTNQTANKAKNIPHNTNTSGASKLKLPTNSTGGKFVPGVNGIPFMPMKQGHTLGDLAREKKTIPLIPVKANGTGSKDKFDGNAHGTIFNPRNKTTDSTKSFPNGNTGISGAGTSSKGTTGAKSSLSSKRTLLNEPRGSTTEVYKDGRTEEMKKKQKEAKEAKEKAKNQPKTVPVFDPATGTVKDVPITASNPNGDLAKSKTKAEQAADIGRARAAEKAAQERKANAERIGQERKAALEKVRRQERREEIGNILGNIVSQIQGGGNGGGDFGGGDVGGGAMMPAQDFAPAMEAAPVELASAQEVVAPTATTAPTSGAPDLTLTAVKMLAPATDLAGPLYGVAFRNQGTAATQGFKLAAVVSDDGQVHADSKKTILEVPGLAVNEVRKMKFRLPRGTSKYVIIMLDADGSVNESDKENNVAMIERAE